jgi:uncharacterized protein YbjT (DUF2867 family)
MKVILFGATGMVGRGVLLECLDEPRITQVVAVGRSSCGVTHPKLREILHQDFLDYSSIQREFADAGACLFCLGVSSAGMDEARYRHLTYDLAVAAAKAILAASPQAAFCFISGQGADSTERGRIMWARVKGATENALLAMPFRGAYMFRPGMIVPMRGVRSRTALYRVFYDILRPLYPVFRRFAPGFVTTSVNVGRAMIEAAVNGSDQRILGNVEIDRLAARRPSS